MIRELLTLLDEQIYHEDCQTCPEIDTYCRYTLDGYQCLACFEEGQLFKSLKKSDYNDISHKDD